MGKTVLKVVQGRAPIRGPEENYRDHFLTAAPVVGLMAIVLMLGLWIPEPLGELVEAAAAFLEVAP